MTMCLFLPDGRVAFMFRRPKITSNDAFDAAGMRFEVIEPFVVEVMRSCSAPMSVASVGW